MRGSLLYAIMKEKLCCKSSQLPVLYNSLTSACSVKHTQKIYQCLPVWSLVHTHTHTEILQYVCERDGQLAVPIS